MNRPKRLVGGLTSRTFGRVGVALCVAAMMLVSGTGVANAAVSLYTVGDFSSRSTAVKRLANCATTEYFERSATGSGITNCNNADQNPYWDQSQLSGFGYVKAFGKQVGNQGGNCPKMSGFKYIKCFYVGGKQPGGVAMTVSAKSSGISAIDVWVDWYYL